MRSAIISALYHAVVWGGLCTLFLCRADATTSDPSAAPGPSVEQARLLVHQALEAEAQGKTDQRDSLLQQALQDAPDLAQARWQSGDVQIDGKWISFDALSQDPKFTAKMEEYRQRRDQAANTFDDQMDLARWCEKAGLKEQEHVHLLAALKLKPNSTEVRKKLGAHIHAWSLASHSEASDAQLRQQQEDLQKWKDRLVKLRGQLENRETVPQALQDLRDINDAAAVPALEIVFGRSKSEIGLAVVQCLSKMPDLSATQSLVRFAVFSPLPDVREAAAKALKSRSMYAYVPTLLSGLNTPISVHYDKFQLPNGSLGYQMSLYKESPWGDKMYTSTGLMDTTLYPSAIANQQARLNNNLPANWTPGSVTVKSDRAAATAPIAAAAAKAEQRANQALAANDQIAASNDRVTSVLTTATGKDLGSDAMAWWSWWLDYNEYDRPEKAPTQYSSDSTYTSPYAVAVLDPQPPAPVLPPGSYHSCFTAGTPVWTQTGLMQIEKIKPGESVLSQNPDTGELAYKTVLSTTVGPPLPLIEVHVRDAVLRCTRGHPFWVSGSGWKMAKELKAGDWLHTVRGPVLVESVENEKDPAVCYNLVVADFDTFFVGKSQILVHDINLRQPTDAIVPGLINR